MSHDVHNSISHDYSVDCVGNVALYEESMKHIVIGSAILFLTVVFIYGSWLMLGEGL